MMRVKIGDTWHKPEPGKGILLDLSDDEKTRIGAMRYSQFAITHPGDPRTLEQIHLWLNQPMPQAIAGQKAR